MIKSMTKGIDHRFPHLPEHLPPAANKDVVGLEVRFFIYHFTMGRDGNTRKEVEAAFTTGCCWWFAYILKARFNGEYDCEIMIDYVANHFATRIEDRVYDITGDVTDAYTWESFHQCTDKELYERLTTCCIFF